MEQEYSFHDRLMAFISAHETRTKREVLYPVSRNTTFPITEREYLPIGCRFEVYTHAGEQPIYVQHVGHMSKASARVVKSRILLAYPPDTYELYLIIPSLANA